MINTGAMPAPLLVRSVSSPVTTPSPQFESTLNDFAEARHRPGGSSAGPGTSACCSHPPLLVGAAVARLSLHHSYACSTQGPSDLDARNGVQNGDGNGDNLVRRERPAGRHHLCGRICLAGALNDWDVLTDIFRAIKAFARVGHNQVACLCIISPFLIGTAVAIVLHRLHVVVG